MKRIADKMQKLDEMKKNFACTAMHELRTPLTCIMGCADMLRELSKDCESDCHDLSNDLFRSAKRLEMLINNMQEIIEGGYARPVCAEPFSINDLVREVESDIRAILLVRKQTLVTKLADNLPRCLGESKRVWQVVTNLVMNAIRFTPEAAGQSPSRPNMAVTGYNWSFPIPASASPKTSRMSSSSLSTRLTRLRTIPPGRSNSCPVRWGWGWR